MSDDREGPECSGRPVFFRVLWLPLALLLAYPLSTGPALKLADKHILSNDSLNTFYAPISALMKHSDLARRLAWWYLHGIWRLELD
jgi:hypothetical protein